MALFAIIAEDDSPTERLDDAIQARYPNDNFRFGERSWFVSADGLTSRTLSEALGIRKGEIARTAVVQLTGGYWGVANTALWDFLKVSLEHSDG